MLKLNLQFFAADALAGTWVFNDTINESFETYTLEFVCGGTNCTYIAPSENNQISPTITRLYFSSIGNVYTNGWKNEAYKTIEITSKLSEVTNGDALLTWLQANATKTAEAETESSSAVTISYNDSVIASLEAGQTATVPCSGKIMQGDMVIAVPEAEEIVLQEKTVTPTEAVQEVTPDEGNTALSKVTVNAIPDEYIVPSGEMLITENGAYNVVRYASVSVGVEAEDSAIPTEVSTEADMTALLESGEVGGVYKYVGTTGTYENGAYYVLEEDVTLITFVIGNVTYQAEEGMTWAEWVASEYNTGGYVNNADDSYIYSADGRQKVSYSGSSILESNVIVDGTAYVLEEVSSGEIAPGGSGN